MSSFECKKAKDIAVAPLVGQLMPLSDNEDGRKRRSDRETRSCAFAPDDSLFVWSKGNRTVVLVPWDAVNRRPQSSNEAPRLEIDCGYPVWSVAIAFATGPIRQSSASSPFHCTGHLLLATGLANSRIRIWDAATGKLIMDLIDHKDVVRDLAFSRDDSMRLVSASSDATLKIWDLRDGGNLVKTLRGHRKWIHGICWAPNSRLLASVGTGKMVLVWNMDSEAYALRHRLEGHASDVVSCDFSPDSALLATASLDTRIILWDPYVGQVLKVLGHLFPPPRLIYASDYEGTSVRGARFSGDGSHLASIADDGFVRFWNLFLDITDPVEIASLNDTLCCSYSTSGSTLAVGTRTGGVSFFRSPSVVPTLLRMCRVAVRARIKSPMDVERLDIPQILHGYLRYAEWQ